MFKFQIRSDSLITRIPCNVTTGINGLSGRFSRRRLAAAFCLCEFLPFASRALSPSLFDLQKPEFSTKKTRPKVRGFLLLVKRAFLALSSAIGQLARRALSCFFIFFLFFSPVFVRYSLCAFFVLFAHFGWFMPENICLLFVSGESGRATSDSWTFN